MHRTAYLKDDVQRLKFDLTSDTSNPLRGLPASVSSSSARPGSVLSSEQHALINRLHKNRNMLTAQQRLQLHQIMQLTGASQSDAGMSMLSSPAPSTCVGRVSIESLGRRELKAKPPESNGQAPTAHFGSPWSQAFSPVASITSEPHRLLNSVSPRSQRSATIHGIRRGHSRQSETRFTAAEKRQLVDILRRQQDQIDTLQNKVKRSKGCSSRGSCANLQTAWIKDSSGTGSFATAHSVSPSSMGPLYPPRSPLTQMTRTAFEKDSDERKWFNEDTPAAGTDEAWLQSFLERDRLHAPGNLLTHQSLRPGQRQVCTVEDLFRSNEPRDSCRSRDYWHRVVCCKP